MASVFKFLKPEEQKKVLRCAHHRNVRPKDILIKEGAPLRRLIVVKDGRLAVRRERGHNYGLQIVHLGPGELIGEAAFLGPHEASASVVADTPAEIFEVDVLRLIPMFKNDAGFCGRFFRSLAYTFARRMRLFNSWSETKIVPKFQNWEII
ncbi:MAG: cyclic nucleotide-binding domain-containing protein [Gammaproteobacteria bacterium]|nr:cyclic nucleotide-binding domain-containing protein [Gammaproteobacteria bacterium]